MTLHQFCSLSLSQRVELVLAYGEPLLLRHDNVCSIFLYHMGGFFAEVWHSASDSRVVMVLGFKNTRILERYLEMIDISELVEKG